MNGRRSLQSGREKGKHNKRTNEGWGEALGIRGIKGTAETGWTPGSTWLWSEQKIATSNTEKSSFIGGSSPCPSYCVIGIKPQWADGHAALLQWHIVLQKLQTNPHLYPSTAPVSVSQWKLPKQTLSCKLTWVLTGPLMIRLQQEQTNGREDTNYTSCAPVTTSEARLSTAD